MDKIEINNDNLIVIDAMPPSVNHYKGLRTTKSGRIAFYRTKDANDWLTYAVAMINSKIKNPFLRPIDVWITVDFSKTNFDLDNLLKCILDAIKMSGVVPDDNVECIPRVHIVSNEKVKKGEEKITLYLYELE